MIHKGANRYKVISGDGVSIPQKFTVPPIIPRVYYIRGNSSSNFDFSLQYIDDKTDEITTVTETAQIDNNGDWEISYSGKRIYSLTNTFYGKTALKTIQITEDLSKCTKLSNGTKGAFGGCTSLTTVDLSNAKLNNVDDATAAFSGCSKLVSVDLSNATFDSLLYCGEIGGLGMFDNCVKLETVVFCENVTFSLLIKCDRMFFGCSVLNSIYLPNATFESVVSAKGMFYNCVKITSINLHSATFESLKDPATTTGLQMFQNCTLLSSLDLSNATFEKVTTCKYMFKGDSALISLSLPNATFESATSCMEMFYGDRTLVSLSFENVDFSKITITTNMFYNCNSLTTLNIPKDGTFISLSSTAANAPLQLKYSPLSYASMLKLANWICDLTGKTSHDITFNQNTYDALAQEQKDTLYDIIHTQKNWTLATANP